MKERALLHGFANGLFKKSKSRQSVFIEFAE